MQTAYVEVQKGVYLSEDLWSVILDKVMNAEAYPEPSGTSKIEFFAKIELFSQKSPSQMFDWILNSLWDETKSS